MAYVEFQNNPVGRRVGDCAVRAVAKALNMGWEAAYIALVINGLQMGDMPSSNSVIGATLRQHGFKRKNIPNECPDCFTVADFAEENYVRPDGSYSRRRGRDAMGRYSSDEGSVDEHTKEELRKLIEQM